MWWHNEMANFGLRYAEMEWMLRHRRGHLLFLQEFSIFLFENNWRNWTEVEKEGRGHPIVIEPWIDWGHSKESLNIDERGVHWRHRGRIAAENDWNEGILMEFFKRTRTWWYVVDYFIQPNVGWQNKWSVKSWPQLRARGAVMRSTVRA